MLPENELSELLTKIRKLTPEQLAKLHQLLDTGEVPEEDREAFAEYMREHSQETPYATEE